MMMQDRSSYERFALPYSFKPRLSVFEAFVSAVAAFLQIFFGSLLFAFWGVYSIVFWQRIPNLLMRFLTLSSLFVLFLILFPLLLLTIRMFARYLARRL